MLRSVIDLIGHTVVATDGKAGKIEDILFGDRSWKMRHLVVETRRFRINLRYLSEEELERQEDTRFLLTPEQLLTPGIGPERRFLPVLLSREEIRECPSVYHSLPVEKEYEAEFTRYFRHGVYDRRPKVLRSTDRVVGYRPPESAYEHSIPQLRRHVRQIKEIATHHLHSVSDIVGYEIRNGENTLGNLEDLILDVGDWTVKRLVLREQRPLLPRSFLLDSDVVQSFDWSEMAIQVKMAEEELTSLRRYVPSSGVNHDERDIEYDYRGKRSQRLVTQNSGMAASHWGK